MLKAHWIDALIDASEFHTALPLINAELSDRRWKSSWLIKRARTLQGLGRNPEVSRDLHTALAEIQSRLDLARPDPLLLADQGVIHALLKQPDKARKCLERLEQLNTPHWITAHLNALVVK